MAYNEDLAKRIKTYLLLQDINFEEKKMFGGLAFMLNDKMCFGIVNEELMLRVLDNHYESLLEQNNVKPMNFTGKTMKGFVFILPEALKTESQLISWLQYGLEFAEKGIVKSKKKK